MSETLLCKDCKHRFRMLRDLPNWGTGHEWRCRITFVPEEIIQDPVIGPSKVPAHYKRCGLIRLHESKYRNECGKEGIYWQPKNKKGLFKLIKKTAY